MTRARLGLPQGQSVLVCKTARDPTRVRKRRISIGLPLSAGCFGGNRMCRTTKRVLTGAQTLGGKLLR